MTDMKLTLYILFLITLGLAGAIKTFILEIKVQKLENKLKDIENEKL
jgi:hypothetical protein